MNLQTVEPGRLYVTIEEYGSLFSVCEQMAGALRAMPDRHSVTCSKDNDGHRCDCYIAQRTTALSAYDVMTKGVGT